MPRRNVPGLVHQALSSADGIVSLETFDSDSFAATSTGLHLLRFRSNGLIQGLQTQSAQRNPKIITHEYTYINGYR